MLVQALTASDANLGSDYVNTLSRTGPYTVLAPNNQAFANLAAALGVSQSELLENDALGEILAYHVISGTVRSSQFTNGQSVQPLFTVDDFTVNTTGGVTIDTDGDGTADATVVQADVDASNGIVHVIDAVLLPPSLFP